MHVPTSFGRITYVKEGRGRPLVFLHGLGAPHGRTYHHLRKFLNVFSQKYTVYAPEHPGQKRTKPPARVMEIQDYVAYIHEFVEHLKIGNFILYGHSFGGKLAMAYAAEHEVDHLIISDSATDTKIGSLREKAGYKLFGLVASLYPHLPKQWLAKRWLSVPDPKGDYHNAFLSIHNVLRSPLKVSHVPTMIFWGKNDLLIPVKQAKKLCGMMGSARLILLDGGHLLPYAQPQKILSFM